MTDCQLALLITFCALLLLQYTLVACELFMTNNIKTKKQLFNYLLPWYFLLIGLEMLVNTIVTRWEKLT